MDAALALLRACIPQPSGSEMVPLTAAQDRILAQAVVATAPLPSQDNSAMDGFALALPQDGVVAGFSLVGQALAGTRFVGAVGAYECIRIATGASLPAGCDTVVPREQATLHDGRLSVADTIERGANIRRCGEDFAAGAVLLAAGTRLQAFPLGLLAAAGVAHLCVRPGLRVAIFSTGNELCATGDPLAPGQIFDANRLMLTSLCGQLGYQVTDFGIVPDAPQNLAAALAQAAREHDVVISSAGTSQGEGDHLAAALRACGGEVLVSGCAIKPGKPVLFGSIDTTAVIALPGNPVAAVTTFLVLALPLLRRLAGQAEEAAPWCQSRSAFSHSKKAGVREYLRVRRGVGDDGCAVEKAGPQGSAMLSALAASEGLVCLDETVTAVTPGMLLPYRSYAELMWA